MSFEIMKRELWQRKEDVNPRFASLFRELAGAADEEEAMGIVIRHWSDFTPEEQRELQRELVANTKGGGTVFDKEAARHFFEAGFETAAKHAKPRERIVYRDRVVEKVKVVEKPRDPRISTPAEHELTHKMHKMMWWFALFAFLAIFVIVMLIVKR